MTTPETGAEAKSDAVTSWDTDGSTGQTGICVCSFCRTQFDSSKVDERRCWLCGGTAFTEPDAEERRRKGEAESREQCCPAPECPRPVNLLARSEKYCIECGAALERVTVELWFRKCVEPSVRRESDRLVSGRAGFMDAAWRMRLSTAEAEARLDEYAASLASPAGGAGARPLDAGAADDQASGTATHGAAPTEQSSSSGNVAGSFNGAPSRRRVGHPLPPESPRREWSLRVKVGAVVLCALVLMTLALLVGRGRPEEEVKSIPTPVPSPTEKPSATPAAPSPPMALIVGGQFEMGRHARTGGDEYETPAHTVTVEPFYMDIYEVTREEYQQCVRAARCSAPPEWGGDTYPARTGRLPVTGVTWDDANAYAAWAGKRLPTEEEWEFAARGEDGRLYPWGRAWAPGRANLGGSALVEVGKYQDASPFGMFDMLGNAQEWTSSELRRYPDKTSYIATGGKPESLRVIRGGSYLDSAREVTTTYRNALLMSKERSYAQTGFRCVKDAPRQ